jgi:hypothetical protein
MVKQMRNRMRAWYYRSRATALGYLDQVVPQTYPSSLTHDALYSTPLEVQWSAPGQEREAGGVEVREHCDSVPGEVGVDANSSILG